MTKRICSYCGNIISSKKYKNKKYCQAKCYYNFLKENPPRNQLGRKHTEEAKEKNRLEHLGKRSSISTEFKKGLIPWNKGKKLPYKPHFGQRGKLCKEKCHLWKGGLPKCIDCGKQISYNSTRCIWCSGKFRRGKNSSTWKGGTVKRHCFECGRIFYIKIYRSKKNNGKFCSPKCNGKWKSKNLVGEKSHFWKGGITPINKLIRTSSRYIRWRNAVYKRDNYTCQWCGVKSGNGKAVFLHADHIKPFSVFPKLRFSMNNGRTLCKKCNLEKLEYYDRWLIKYIRTGIFPDILQIAPTLLKRL